MEALLALESRDPGIALPAVQWGEELGMRVDMQEIDELPPLEIVKQVTPSDRSTTLWQGHRQRMLLAAALFVCFAFIYSVSRNRSYTYDGVVFAHTIENPITMLPRNIALEWNHFLWYPTARAFYLALNSFHVPMRGYEALELMRIRADVATVLPHSPR